MRAMRRPTLIVTAMICALTMTAYATDPKIEKKQKEIRNMAHDTLQRLYEAAPRAKSAVRGAAGYAVFSNLGVKILVAGSGNGKGIAVNNKTKRETFMKMIELQAGLGMGVKKFSVIFVFDNERAFDSFVDSGWQFGGQTTAATKMEIRANRSKERCRFRTASGCTSSPTRESPWKSLPRARSTTRTMT